ncbi:MAG: aminoglycoside phosphotransferase family protein [Chloroflexi bacterium]|nr:aminoglycoside phosphotransferase family protein [Chloroflexota bacterium]
MEKYARKIIANTLGKNIATIQRFPTGLSHFVFDVVADDNFSCVIRIAKPERSAEIEEGLSWQAELEKVGAPLPEIYHSGRMNGSAYAIYEKLPGNDLEITYPSLTSLEKKEIAYSVAEIQQKVHTLNKGLFKEIYPWKDVLHWIINRSEREILATRLCDPKFIDLARERMQKYADYFETVEPRAFLYDLNIRNVIVLNGKVTGIIDVDEIWFGDPLLAIGRGKAILLSMRQETDFISYWRDFLNLSPLQTEMVDFYALLYTVRFMGTMGQELNGNQSIQTDPSVAPLLEDIAHRLL